MNDNPITTGSPISIAFWRGAASSIIIGGLAFLGTWTTTDDGKTLVIATLTPVLTSLALRFGLEGYIDTKRQ